MKKITPALFLALLFTSCMKDQSPVVCMEKVDKNGFVISEPFKQSEDWAKRNTNGNESYHILPASFCR